jgi:glycosyltransferase involved in cell wall biosynthesis
MTAPAISLIVATVGRTAELDRLIESLAAQTFKDFEVIVVDQNSDDRLAPGLERARAAGLALKHVKLQQANLSGARNAGIEIAGGNWVGFPDDDCWYEPDTLERLTRRFQCTDPLSGAALQWVEEGIDPPSIPNLTWERSRLFRDIPVASFQLFFHRRLFEKIGNFDCRLGVGLWFGAGEETDFVLRALHAGALLTYEPQARVHHPFKRAAMSTAQGRLAARLRARGAGALYVKHGLPIQVVVRGLVAPVLRPLLRGKFGYDLAHGCAVTLGRLDGLRRWNRQQ